MCELNVLLPNATTFMTSLLVWPLNWNRSVVSSVMIGSVLVCTRGHKVITRTQNVVDMSEYSHHIFVS